MRLNTWIRCSVPAAGVALTLAGCNLFNPGGVREDACDAHDATCHILTGESLYRDGRYPGAAASFEKAIAIDSARSMAYYGYAKATVRQYKLDNIGILNDLDSTKSDTTGKIFFVKPDNQPLMTRRLQGAGKIRKMLEILEDRDSLTRFYRYLNDSTSAEALEDTNYVVRRDFMTEYVSRGDQQLSGYRHKSKFPLSDREMPFGNLTLDLGAFTTLHAVTRAYDVTGDGIIDFSTRDSIMLNAGFGSGGGFDNLTDIAGDLEEDSVLVQDMNNLIMNLSTDLSAASNLIAQLAPPPAEGGSQDASQQTQQNIDSIIQSMGSTITFYLLGDKIDNDGDGCIDEELLDGKDNDGDGFVDEDSRVIPGDKPDLVDNDRNGRKDPFLAFVNDVNYDSLEAKVDTGEVPWRLGFVQAFLDASGHHPDSLWVKILKDAPDMNLRTKVQEWGLSTKTKAELTGPLASKLDSAKALIGGCWRNYPDHAP